MRLPVSRLAYDNAVADRDHWRDLATRAIDQLTRLERVREGLPETPVERRKPSEPLPASTELIIDRMWGAEHARLSEKVRARKLYADLKDWEQVNAVLLESPDQEE